MNDEPNLQQFVDKLSSYSDETPQTGTAVPAVGEKMPAIGIVQEIAGSGSCVSDGRRPCSTSLPTSHDLSVAMAGQVGSQIKMQVASSWLIANVRTMRAGDAERSRRQRRFPRRGPDCRQWPDEQFPPRRHPLSDPRQPDLSGQYRGHARHLRRRRQPAYRDRHRLSDRRHPRRALRRPDAVEAFRGAGIDRYRQVDRGQPDPPPHLASCRPRAIS